MKNSNRRLAHLMRTGPAGVLAGLMLLAATTVQAADIHVAAGVVLADNEDGQCSLIGAIENANAGDSSGDSDCAAGTAGADTLILPANAHYLLQAPFEQPPFASDTGFPYVTSEITILGNGSTIERNAAAANFRLMHVADTGNLSLDSVTLKGGLGTGDFPGGAIHANGSLSIHNSTLTGNRADYGGAIFFYQVSDAIVTITDSVLSANHAIQGGAMYMVGIRGARYTIANTVISDNVADQLGGALYVNAGEFELRNSTLSGNQAIDGGAAFVIFSGHPFGRSTRTVLISEGSTFMHNSAGQVGGANYCSAASCSIGNSTFHGNTAGTRGGAIFASAGQNNDRVSITRSTFYQNSAGDDAALALLPENCDVANSLFVNHASGACFTGAGCFLAGNISDEASCDASGAPTPGAGNVGPLAFNGGPTQTHALTPGHPAIDAIDRSLIDAFCFASNGFTRDQRGVRRYAYGNQCDVGAFEFGAEFDLGDALDPGFPSLLASNGAAHVTNNPAFASLYLGANPPDIEADAAQSADADGDDLSGDNDEDGVDSSFVLLIGRSNDLPVTVNGSGRLNAWVDFNNDGDWDDAGEQIASNVDVASLGGTLPVVVPGDAVPGTVMSRFRVSSDGGGRVTGVANDGEVEDHKLTLNDVVPTVSLSVDNADINESGGVATVTATLSDPIADSLNVTLAITGTAANDTDYTIDTTTITIDAGAASGTAVVTAIDDLTDEPDETVIVDIDTVSAGAEAGSPSQVTVTIIDDDDVPTVMFNGALNPEIPEAAGSFVIPDAILLSNPSSLDVTVELAVDAGSQATSPEDFTIPSMVTIPAGDTSADLAVTVVDDSDVEGNETAVVNLVNPANATLGDPAQGTAVILDNDESSSGGDGDGGGGTDGSTGSDGGGDGGDTGGSTSSDGDDGGTGGSTGSDGDGDGDGSGTGGSSSGGGSSSNNDKWYDISGCTLGRPGGPFDPTLPLLMLLAMGYLGRVTRSRNEYGHKIFLLIAGLGTVTVAAAVTDFTVGDATVPKPMTDPVLMDFDITRGGDTSIASRISYLTRDGTATAGEDYSTGSACLSFPPDSTLQTVQIPILPGTSTVGENFHFDLFDGARFTLQQPSAPAISLVASLDIPGGNPTFPATAPVIADFNRDRKPDFAHVNTDEDPDVSVFINTSTGDSPTFASEIGLSTSGSRVARTVVAADINMDGYPDLISGFDSNDAIGQPYARGISVFINNQSGGFFASEEFAAIPAPFGSSRDIASGDFNKDGKPDIALLNGVSVVVVYVNTTTTGTMPSFEQVHLGFAPEFRSARKITAADYNGDGYDDLAITIGDSKGSHISVRFNSGTDTPSTEPVAFREFVEIAGEGWGLASPDINKDGKPDLALASDTNRSLAVYLNTANPGASAPSFATPHQLATVSSANYIATGDLNRDNKPDLLTSNPGGDQIAYFINTTPAGSGAASFSTRTDVASPRPLPRELASADLNGDGFADVVNLYGGDGGGRYIYKNDVGDITGQQTVAGGNQPRAVEALDINLDGKPDFALVNSSGSILRFGINQSNPGDASTTFATQDYPNNMSWFFGDDIIGGDLNKDGKPDLVTNSTNHGGSLVVLINATTAGASSATFSETSLSTGDPNHFLELADINKDGKLDIIVGLDDPNPNPGGVGVFLNTTADGAASATFGPLFRFRTGSAGFTTNDVSAADVNGDGKLDIVTANTFHATSSVLLNTTVDGDATPTFSAAQTFVFLADAFINTIEMPDINADGRADMLVSLNQFGFGGLAYRLNTTAPNASMASFDTPVTLPTKNADFNRTAIVDINGDCRLDIAVTNYNDSSVSFYIRPAGVMAFDSSHRLDNFIVGQGPSDIALTDFNLDGRLDFITSDAIDQTATVQVMPFSPSTATATATGTIQANDAGNGGGDDTTFDLGDAPDPGFPTLLASNGAAHVTNNPASTSPPYLGDTPPDSEADGLPSENADGDDLSGGTNDEDGIASDTVLLIGQSNDLPVTVTGTGWLNAWVDFNNDGDWDDAGEQVASDIDMAASGGILTVIVPGDAVPGTVMSRFRISSAGGDKVDGLANDGEVEDHAITLAGNQVSMPTVMFNGALNPEIPEAAGSFVIPDAILLSNPSSVDVTVELAVDAGSQAVSPEDFTIPSMVTIPAGETSADLAVTVVDDSEDEINETAVVNLLNPANATLGDPAQGTAVILDDDESSSGGDGGGTDGDDGGTGGSTSSDGDGGSTGGSSSGDDDDDFLGVDIPGCSLSDGRTPFDPLLLIMLAVSMGWLGRRTCALPEKK